MSQISAAAKARPSADTRSGGDTCSEVNPRDLDEIIRDLQKFDNDRAYVDPRGLELLQAAAIDKLKKFEFMLRRKAEAGNDSLSLSGSDQVPDGFRQAIEEYYRSLAKKAPLR